MKTAKRMIAFLLLACLILQMSAWADDSSEASESTPEQTLDPRIIVSGMELRPMQDGSVQGLLEIRLKDVATTGFGFNLLLDTNYFQLSDYTTNVPTNNVQPNESNEKGFFAQNVDDFPLGCFFNMGFDGDSADGVPDAYRDLVIGSVKAYENDDRYSVLHMNFSINTAEENVDYGKHYRASQYEDQEYGVLDMTDAPEGYQIGYLSFRVMDAEGLMRLTPSARSKLISVHQSVQNDYDFTAGAWIQTMIDDVQIGYDGEGYTDENGMKVEPFYTGLDYIDLLLNFSAVVSGVRADQESANVLACDLYQDGTVNDLIAYLNRHLSEVTVTYTDNSERPDVVKWSLSDAAVAKEGGGDYDCTGGDYTVEQVYYENADQTNSCSVAVTIHVIPVNITGYYAAPEKEYIVYNSESDWPIQSGVTGEALLTALDLPKTATPIFNQVVVGKEILETAEVDSDSGWRTQNGNVTSPTSYTPYVYSANVKMDALKEKFPWVSNVAEGTVEVTRMVGSRTAKPVVDQAYATVDDGLLIVHVSGLTNSTTGALANIRSFIVRLPNGQTVPADAISFECTGEDKTYSSGITVTVDPSKAGDLEEITREYINLGGEFSIAAQGGIEATASNNASVSEFVPVVSAPRINLYLGPENEDGSRGTEYVFDYSGVKSGTLPIGFNPALSNRFTLADGDRIETAINGETGEEGGSLCTFCVDRWTLEDADSVSPEQPGQVLTYTGTLVTAYYAGYGTVTAPDALNTDADGNATGTTYDAITVKLLVKTQNESADESVQPIDDYYFDTQRLGYETLASQSFSVVSTGATDIAGLSVTLSEFTSTANLDVEGFRVSKKPVRYLSASGGATDFEISLVPGLPVGNYSAKVTVSSDQSEDLAHFQVYVTVTEQPLYSVVAKVDEGDTTGSSVALVAGSRYSPGDVVQILVKPGTDGKLDSWISNYLTTITDTNGVMTTVDNIQITQDGAYIPPTDHPEYERYVFTMPKEEEMEKLVSLTVIASFAATDTAKLRLRDLRFRDTVNSTTDSDVWYNLHDRDFKQTSFDPAQVEWNVVLPDGVTVTELEFEPADSTLTAADGFSQTLTYIQYDAAGAVTGTQQIACGMIQTDGYYKPTDQVKAPDPAKARTDVVLARTFSAASGGSTTLTYTIHVYQAVAEENRITLNYGNSPYGLIERMDEWSSSEKTAAERYFDTYYRFEEENAPDGGDASIVYRPEAWGAGENYDKDPYALFIYQGESFADPGFVAAQDSLGNDLTVQSATVSITLQKFRNDTPTGTLQSDFKATESVTRTYVLNETAYKDVPVSALSGLRILPGRYAITYTFKDYDGSSFQVERELFILAGAGDVNVSGQTDSDDGAYIRRRVSAALPYDTVTGYSDALLYEYRVCDVNHDGVVNSVDANWTTAASVIPEYYSGGASSGTTWTIPTEKATLYLDYLGTGAAPQDTAQPIPKFTAQDVAGQTVIWVGVRAADLNRIPQATSGLYNLELAFDYDPDYLAPCGTGGEETGSGWLQAVTAANLKSGVGESDAVYWDADSYAVAAEEAGIAAKIDDSLNRDFFYDPYSTDAAKSILTSWRMAYFNLSMTGSGTARFSGLTSAEDQYLIRVPFLLKKVPTTGAAPIPLTITCSPDQFVMGAGTEGISPYAQWRSTDDTMDDPAVNLKNYFTLAENGLLDLFTPDSGGLSGITLLGQTAGEADVPVALTPNFSAAVTQYSAEIPETTSMNLAVTTDDAEVTAVRLVRNGTADSPLTANSDGTWTFLVSQLQEGDVLRVTVKTESGDTLHYEITLTRDTGGEEKPAEITLNPGNATENDVEKYADLGVEETTIFVYYKYKFRDSGFTVTDADGNAVSTDLVNRYYRPLGEADETANPWTAFPSTAAPYAADEAIDGVFHIDPSAEYSKGYQVKYEYGGGVAYRNVFVIFKLGDVDMTGGVDYADGSLLTQYTMQLAKLAGIDTDILYKNKVANVDQNGGVDYADGSLLTQYTMQLATYNQLYAADGINYVMTFVGR